ncbi:Trimethylguanosine synthase-like protein [Mycena chlorophos]|uniref:Trimethylguanosine synthase-like protein n=1 Tax=Mycena chlorophos TaxID=658473 RepID=A0A8H6ST49_MYCCL|nr:Trimethylguanosine synthase-like protein [Mycena chlorophos]
MGKIHRGCQSSGSVFLAFPPSCSLPPPPKARTQMWSAAARTTTIQSMDDTLFGPENASRGHLVIAIPAYDDAPKTATVPANLAQSERNPAQSTPQKVRHVLPCRICGKEVLGANMKRHEKVHTGERPHVCMYPDCGWAFAQKHTLSKHIAAKHSIPHGAGTDSSGRSTQGDSDSALSGALPAFGSAAALHSPTQPRLVIRIPARPRPKVVLRIPSRANLKAQMRIHASPTPSDSDSSALSSPPDSDVEMGSESPSPEMDESDTSAVTAVERASSSSSQLGSWQDPSEPMSPLSSVPSTPSLTRSSSPSESLELQTDSGSGSSSRNLKLYHPYQRPGKPLASPSLPTKLPPVSAGPALSSMLLEAETPSPLSGAIATSAPSPEASDSIPPGAPAGRRPRIAGPPFVHAQQRMVVPPRLLTAPGRAAVALKLAAMFPRSFDITQTPTHI